MVVQALKDEGVEYVFGYPGGAVLHIYDALFKHGEGLTHVLVRHEQAATHMADGYARATGKPGVVLVTSGPGATNAITGIATAYMDSIPMVVISGQVPRDMIGDDAFQETDMVGISRPIVKHSFMVQHAAADSRDRQEGVPHRHHRPTRARCVIDIPKDVTDPAVTFDVRLPERVSACAPTTRSTRGQQRPDPQGRAAAARGQAPGHLRGRRRRASAMRRRNLRRLARNARLSR